MFNSIIQNLGTIAIGLVIAAIVAVIIVKLVKDKKRGKHLGCDCDSCGASCPYATDCESGKK